MAATLARKWAPTTGGEPLLRQAQGPRARATRYTRNAARRLVPQSSISADGEDTLSRLPTPGHSIRLASLAPVPQRQTTSLPPEQPPAALSDAEGFPFGGGQGAVDLTGGSDAVLRARIQSQQAANRQEQAAVAAEPADAAGVQGEVLRFALPALGGVLADPLMSLVDTAAVGQFSSLHLAALAPNTSIFNLFFQLFTFLGITTTSLIARRAASAAGLPPTEAAARRDASSRVLGHAMVLALGCGLACCGVMLAFGPAMLSALGASPETRGPALSYLRIRALASPAVMVANVAQGALLGQSDSWTPLKVLAASGALNLGLDYLLVIQAGWGITGAAVATTAAQVLAAGFFLVYLRRRGEAGELVPLRWHGLPTAVTLGPFWDMASTLLSRTLFTMLAYTSLTTAATGLGTVCAAAHQVGLQVFWFLSEAPQALSVTGQSLIARERRRPATARAIVHTLLRLGGAFGAAMAGTFALLMTRASWLFTADPMVQALVSGLALPGAVALLLCAVVMVFDGASIGMGRFRHLPTCNLGGLAATGGALALASHLGLGLAGIWFSLLGFFGARQALHLLHHRTGWQQGLFGNGPLQPALAPP